MFLLQGAKGEPGQKVLFVLAYNNSKLFVGEISGEMFIYLVCLCVYRVRGAEMEWMEEKASL